jgi:hypothetical protein
LSIASNIINIVVLVIQRYSFITTLFLGPFDDVITKFYCIRNRTYAKCRERFIHKYHAHMSTKSCVSKLIKKWQTTGSVLERTRYRKKTMFTDQKLEYILAWLQISPRKSLRRLSHETGVRRMLLLPTFNRNRNVPTHLLIIPNSKLNKNPFIGSQVSSSGNIMKLAGQLLQLFSANTPIRAHVLLRDWSQLL